MSPTSNRKSFNVSKITSKSFSIIIDGFTFATSLFFRFAFKIPITFAGSAIGKLSTNINLRRVRLTISKMNMIFNVTQVFNLRRVRLNLTMKEIGKIAITFRQRNPISFISRAIQKLSITFRLRRISISFSPTLATFYTLAIFDPQTLGTLDTRTLGSMDYAS